MWVLELLWMQVIKFFSLNLPYATFTSGICGVFKNELNTGSWTRCTWPGNLILAYVPKEGIWYEMSKPCKSHQSSFTSLFRNRTDSVIHFPNYFVPIGVVGLLDPNVWFTPENTICHKNSLFNVLVNPLS